jgi:hypothetical protein
MLVWAWMRPALKTPERTRPLIVEFQVTIRHSIK